MKTYPELNDCCNVLYDGREYIARVIAVDLDSDTFDVITSFGEKMWNIPFEKFRYNSIETAIHKYDTVEKIVSQLERCNYESEGGCLINNVAFISLKRMSMVNNLQQISDCVHPYASVYRKGYFEKCLACNKILSNV